jgi:hypothetical protein
MTVNKKQQSEWVAWLNRTGAHLVDSRVGWWRLYRHALVPASIAPVPMPLLEEEARELLKRSGASLIRYFTRLSETPTEFWWVGCESYDAMLPHKKTRNQIRRAYRNCVVRRIGVEVLKEQGYACYAAAFSRYRDARPVSAAEFGRQLDTQQGGPYERWGVFVGNVLAGFANCLVEDGWVSLVSMKLHPKFLEHYPAYALMDTLCTEYVSKAGLGIWNGFRPVSHDTNMQEFIAKFGFRRYYCDLQIFYSAKLEMFIKSGYHLRSVVQRLPNVGPISSLQSLVLQETIRRSMRLRRESPCMEVMDGEAS